MATTPTPATSVWQQRGRATLLALAAPLAALAVAMVIASIVLVASGSSPLTSIRTLWSFGTELETLVATINRATPFYLSGIAAAIGFRMNLFNIGVEGQYVLAAFLAAAAGAAIDLPPVLHVTVIIGVAMLAGALWAGLAGLLKAYRGVHEVISTIMLNAIAVSLVVSFLLQRWQTDSDGVNIQLDNIEPSGRMPNINWLLELFTRDVDEGVELGGFVLLAVVVGVGYHLLLNRTRLGFDLRATGANAEAAEVSGVDPRRTIVVSMLIGGAVAGLVGLPQLLGIDHTYGLQFTQGLGFAGIAVALLGRNHPAGVAVAAFIFGWLDASALALDAQDVAPSEVVTIIKGVIILAAVVAYAVVERRRRSDEAARAAIATDAPPTDPDSTSSPELAGAGS